MITEIESLITKITDEIKKRTDVAVIGLSGGADSTLVACLCLKALGRDSVYGIHLPYGDTDRQKFNSRSQLLASKLGIKNVLIPVGNICNTIDAHSGPALQSLENPNFKYPTYQISLVNSGNTRSRVRMCLLYSLCHELGDTLKKRTRVIGTGNPSEDYIGYDTKGGDALADFFPIGQLFKSEVYQLLDYFKDSGLISEDLIDRTPSAGLWENQSDEKELGYSYNEMEPAIKYLLDSSTPKPSGAVALTRFEEVCKFVEDRHKANSHKHEAPYVISVRNFCK